MRWILAAWLAVPVTGASGPGCRGDLLATLAVRGRAPPAPVWTRGGLGAEWRALVRAAREPGRVVEEARIFRPRTNEWALPAYVVRPGVADTKLFFDVEHLSKLARGAVLAHTHPAGAFAGGPDQRARFALPSPDDVRLAARLRREAGARFVIVSPHLITEVIAEPDARAERPPALEAVARGLHPRDTFAAVSRRWPGVRVRLLRELP